MPASGDPIADLLNDLIQLDHDAIEAYDKAIDQLENGDSRSRLRSFRGDHERHTVELSRLVRDRDVEPASSGAARRLLTRGKVALGALSGDEAILEAMRSNEDETNERYEKALAHGGLPPEVAECLSRNLSDERLHRAWIEERLARR